MNDLRVDKKLFKAFDASNNANPYQATSSTLASRVLYEKQDFMAKTLYVVPVLSLVVYANDINIVECTKQGFTAKFNTMT